ncbi:MAG: LamG domain-containing protein [Pirellulaceae bacterium]
MRIILPVTLFARLWIVSNSLADESRESVPKPIAHWAMDDKDQIAKDDSGGHDGKIVGATSQSGAINGSLEFVRSRGDHVEIPYSDDFAISTFTVSASVYLTNEPTFSGILGTRHGGSFTFDMKVNGDKVHGDIGDGKKWIETKVNFYSDDTGSNHEGGNLDLNRWYHIAYVIDNDQKECRLYLNADLKKRIAFNGTPILMTPQCRMHLGHSSNTEFMDGRIDEVKVWNQSLTDDQIRREFDSVDGDLQATK